MFTALSRTKITTATTFKSVYRNAKCSVYLSLTSPIPFFFSTSRWNKDQVSDGSGEEDDDVSAFMLHRNIDGAAKLFVVQPRLRPEPLLQGKLSEALNLASSLNDRRNGDNDQVEDDKNKITPPHIIVQNPLARSKGRADKFFGTGTVENIKCHLNSIDSEDVLDGIFVNAILSGVQQRNLENAWGKPVLDRIALIIEIFNAHAQTKEAKLQSELAALMYRSNRLVRVRGPNGRLTFGMSGEAEVVSAKGKGSGGRGFLSGAGESELHLQRRRIHERREHLRHEIEEVRRTRALQRYARKRRGGSQGQGLTTVAVVGYTNAGKSTLVSALSKSNLYRDDRLFATVDPLLRSVILPSGRKTLLSDTVGFISELPIQLVEAFHATLEEVVDADLLVHVLDSSSKSVDEQHSTVLQVLKQIGVSEEKINNMIEVWNKVDLLDKKPEEAPVTPDQYIDDTGTNEFSSEDDKEVSREQNMDEFSSNTVDIETDEYCSEVQNKRVGSTLSSCYPIEDINKDASDHGDLDDNTESQFVGEPSSDKSLFPRPKYIERVKTSAVMGVGLHELLRLIDHKLGSQKSLEKGIISEIYDRKWRPSDAKDEKTL